MRRVFFLLALAINFLFLLTILNSLSISYHEARAFFATSSLSAHVARLSCFIFGDNDYALRLPFLLIHCLNLSLLYLLSLRLLKQRGDAAFAVLLYAYLPGVMASAIVVNDAGIHILLTLLACLLFLSVKIYAKILFYIILAAMIFIDQSFLLLYVGFFAYFLYRKIRFGACFCAVLVAVNFWLYGFETGGRPSGHFLDTIGIFAAVFSPLVFLYFVYSIYRVWVKEHKNIIFFISFASFVICMLLSLRQRIWWEYFLPFCVIATPIMVHTFMASYRVRLPQFRFKYRLGVFVVFLFLIMNLSAVVFYPYLYLFLQEPKSHFAYKFDIVKDLAFKLKSLGIYEVKTDDIKLGLRLKFYGIASGGKRIVTGCLKNEECINITRAGRVVASFGLR